MKITILTDNKNSWFIPYGKKLVSQLKKANHDVLYVFNKKDILGGDICFLLSCSNIVDAEYLNKNKNNIVVHASDLPKGKGFSPMQWQILEGKNDIILTLFEAIEAIDAGPYYLKDKIEFNGTELYDELRDKLAQKIIEMCLSFVINYDDLKPKIQIGQATIYRKRTKEDDRIDISKCIVEQFNHFRIADNKKFPLWFEYKGEKFSIMINKTNK